MKNISKRDYFASKIVPALIGEGYLKLAASSCDAKNNPSKAVGECITSMVNFAYLIADMMCEKKSIIQEPSNADTL